VFFFIFKVEVNAPKVFGCSYCVIQYAGLPLVDLKQRIIWLIINVKVVNQIVEITQSVISEYGNSLAQWRVFNSSLSLSLWLGYGVVARNKRRRRLSITPL